MGKPLELGFNIFATSSSTSVTSSATTNTTSATISTTSAATTDSNQNKSNSRVNIGVGVGVGVGGAILLTAVGLFLWRRRKLTSNINSGQRFKSYILPEQRQCEELEAPERKRYPVELGPGRKQHGPHELEGCWYILILQFCSQTSYHKLEISSLEVRYFLMDQFDYYAILTGYKVFSICPKGGAKCIMNDF